MKDPETIYKKKISQDRDRYQNTFLKIVRKKYKKLSDEDLKKLDIITDGDLTDAVKKATQKFMRANTYKTQNSTYEENYNNIDWDKLEEGLKDMPLGYLVD